MKKVITQREVRLAHTKGTKTYDWYEGEGYYLAQAGGSYTKINDDEVEEYHRNGDILPRRKGHTMDDDLSFISDANLSDFAG